MALLLAAAGLGPAVFGACGGNNPGQKAAVPDSATDRYYVRLRTSADPGEVAARHGVEPLAVVTDGTSAFYAALTDGQVRSLRDDSLVTSLSREIHQGRDTSRVPLRGVSTDTPADSGGRRSPRG